MEIKHIINASNDNTMSILHIKCMANTSRKFKRIGLVPQSSHHSNLFHTFAISDFELETLYFIQQNQYRNFLLCLQFHKADSLSFGAIKKSPNLIKNVGTGTKLSLELK